MADAFPGALTPAEIAERALRKIGAMGSYETTADPAQTEIALKELATIIHALSGNRLCWWLVPETLTFVLTANTWSYDLSNALGTNWPTDGVQWVVQAWVRPTASTGKPNPVEIVRRDQFEILPSEQGGTPSCAYLDRSINKRLDLDASPGTDDPSLTFGLVVQTYAPDVTASQSDAATKFEPAWNLWLSTRLAVELGDGIITSVEVGRLDRWRLEAQQAWSDLMSGSAQQRVSSPPICDPYPF